MVAVGFEGKWLWPATRTEEFFEMAHQIGTMLVAYQLSLVSKAPLLEEQVREALNHLYRKVPNLRVCLGERDGVMWMREVSNKEIDFQVLPNGEKWDVINCLRSYKYNVETGPMWCARLIPDTDTASEGKGHHYHLMIGYHHSITDGISCMKICGFIVSLLNDVISGTAIDDSVQLGEYVGHDETERQVEQKKLLFQRDPELCKSVKEAIDSQAEIQSIFANTCQIMDPTKKKTRSLVHTLEPDVTSKFFRKCRAEGVTIHSGFTSLIYRAIVELIKQKGVEQDSYTIINNHVISILRYWSCDHSHVLGCNILGPMILHNDIPGVLVPGKFWDFARLIHKDLQKALGDGLLLQKQALFPVTSFSKKVVAGFLRGPVAPDFGTSNLGDVTSLVTEGGEHVQPTSVLRTVSIHESNASWSHLFNTYKGRFIHVLDYNCETITKDLAEKYMEIIFKLWVEVSE